MICRDGAAKRGVTRVFPLLAAEAPVLQFLALHLLVRAICTALGFPPQPLALLEFVEGYARIRL